MFWYSGIRLGFGRLLGLYNKKQHLETMEKK
jgi:hypothetical protein